MLRGIIISIMQILVKRRAVQKRRPQSRVREFVHVNKEKEGSPNADVRIY